MKTRVRKSHLILNPINIFIVDYGVPTNISLWWNFGSLLGLSLVIQLLRGIFLAIFYTSDISLAFSRVIHISRDVTYGWLLRSIHANGASLFFVCLYIHIARGLYYFSWRLKETWTIGVILFILVIATAFIGYVLPWGQIRFWGATVITRLLSAIPYIGPDLVYWVWGGFAVDNPTLTRFFALHFLLPFVIAALSIIHLIFLHQTGGTNPLGITNSPYKIPIHPYFTNKDIIGFCFTILLFLIFVLFIPNILGDPENFIPANPLSTPLHIKPEWYFLWLYAILRRIPNKLGGVIFIFAALLIIFLYPTFSPKKAIISSYKTTEFYYWSLISSIFVLTWIGGCPVEYPYEIIGFYFTILYFLLTFLLGFTLGWRKYLCILNNIKLLPVNTVNLIIKLTTKNPITVKEFFEGKPTTKIEIYNKWHF